MYGTKENYNEGDRAGGIDEKPKYTFLNTNITYNQRTNGYKMGCIFHAGLGCVSDITARRFSVDDIKELARLCESKYNWTAKDGMYLNDGMNAILEFTKGKGIELESRLIKIGSDEFYRMLDLGYSIHTGFRGNAKWNADKNDDCILQGGSFGSTTYGHSIRLIKDGQLIKIVDNYSGDKCNVYTLLDFAGLIKNGLLFKGGYIYIPKQKPMPEKIMPEHNKGVGDEVEIVKAWETECDPAKLKYNNYIDKYFITKMLIDLANQRK